MVNEEYKIHHIWERIGKIEEKLDKVLIYTKPPSS